jgi:delta24(24(1))-sterol reductase
MSKGDSGQGSTRQLRKRAGSPPSSTKVNGYANGNGKAAPSADQVKEAKEAHAKIVEAQNTDYNHSYGHVDMRDEQIIGGGKEKALQRYTPGIVISEKGREQDKKLDEHYE